jgi:FtsP/CotA-like multicopper oxidase with cupredoxin domain
MFTSEDLVVGTVPPVEEEEETGAAEPFGTVPLVSAAEEEEEEEETGAAEPVSLPEPVERYTRFITMAAIVGWILAILFAALLGVYFDNDKIVESPPESPIGPLCNSNLDPALLVGVLTKAPIILKLSLKTDYSDVNYKRMFIEGFNAQSDADIRWLNQSNFWYIEALPVVESENDCPLPVNITSPPNISVGINSPNISSCNLYDFRVVIFNNLPSGATVHFHGLTPPSNEDGVPFVANANIHSKNLQYYRFSELNYAGMHWMHAHTGFQQAFGVAAPIIFQHSEAYLLANNIDKSEDVIAVLEEGFIYPHCAYSTFWYPDECANSTTPQLGFFINRQETPLEYFPGANTSQVRIRFLNAGSEAPWRITDTFAPEYSGFSPGMDIIATDGNDVFQSEDELIHDFVIGIANRVDILVQMNHSADILITAVQMMHRGNVTNPVLRHIILHGSNSSSVINPETVNLTRTGTSDILGNFGILDSLRSVHRLLPKPVTRNITVMNKGGDQFGGFPLMIYNQTKMTLDDELYNLYPPNNYTALNKLKFQLPPYKLYRNNETGETISTRRPCSKCSTHHMNTSGLRSRPTNNSDFIDYGQTEVNTSDSNLCCWEWCNVPEDECFKYNIANVDSYHKNEHYIPVCYGDRVRLLFINSASFEANEGHPMHLHGHNFVLRELFNVTNNTLVKTMDFKEGGPLLDTIWVPWGTAVSFDFDAFNPGESLFHCHNDFHLENGMMTTVRYMSEDFGCQDFPTEFIGSLNELPTQLCNMDGCDADTT